jgi:hypothetical protein
VRPAPCSFRQVCPNSVIGSPSAVQCSTVLLTDQRNSGGGEGEGFKLERCDVTWEAVLVPDVQIV